MTVPSSKMFVFFPLQVGKDYSQTEPFITSQLLTVREMSELVS